MNPRVFFYSLTIIVKRDLVAHFSSLSNNFISFLYFITGVVFWAASLGRLVSLPGYFQFLIVGLMILGVYNTSFYYMNVVSREVRKGYLKYLLALPISRGGFTLGRVLTGALTGMTYVAGLFIFAALVMGLPTVTGALVIISAVAACSFCLSSLGIAIAMHFKQEMIDPVSDILGLSLIFTSTLFYPRELMPGPLKVISSANVLSAGANLMRAGFGLEQTSLQDAIVILGWSVIFGILSIRGYYKRLEELR